MNKNLIKERGKWGMELGLKRIEKLMAYLNHPENELKVVHIAGSNGKGSVTRILETILTESGYKVGSFSSPAMETDNDRIRICEESIDDETLENLLDRVLEAAKCVEAETGERATGFELETALAYLYFFESGVDIALIEVGLGGRLDATNIVRSPLVAVITHIALEHTKYLGTTLAEIAAEKGAIIKDNAHVVIAPQEEEAETTLREIISNKETKGVSFVSDEALVLKNDLGGQLIQINDRTYPLALLGDFQRINLQTALAVLESLDQEGFPVENEEIVSALERITFPGRFENFSNDPQIIIDGAHNLDGINHLAGNLRDYFGEQKFDFIFGMLEEKDVTESLKKIVDLADTIYLLEPDNPEALSNLEIEREIKNLNGDVKTVLVGDYGRMGDYLEGQNLPLVVTGSLYLISKLRPILKKDLNGQGAGVST